MSAVCKLSTKLPGDVETNGLDAFAHHLIENPDDLIAGIVWIDAQKVVIDTDSDTTVPTARIRRIEILGPIGDVPDSVRDLVGAAFQKRTGRKAIPFESGSVDEGYDPDQPELDA